MKKNTYRFRFAALLMVSLIALSGCKSREKIDLTGIHSTETETMGPSTETMADQTSAEKETAAETKKETEGANKPEADKGKDSSAALSVRSKIATQKEGKTSIEYPILSNLTDSKMEETVNALIKEKALQILKDYEINTEKDTLEIKCKIVSLDRSKAVLTYQGSLLGDGNAHPTAVFYTTTVDLNKGILLGLSDYADAYAMADYILSDDCEVLYPSGFADEVIKYFDTLETDYLRTVLKRCDFNAEEVEGLEGFPLSFSYENQGAVYISVPVPHAVGDYAIIKFTPETK